MTDLTIEGQSEGLLRYLDKLATTYGKPIGKPGKAEVKKYVNFLLYRCRLEDAAPPEELITLIGRLLDVSSHPLVGGKSITTKAIWRAVEFEAKHDFDPETESTASENAVAQYAFQGKPSDHHRKTIKAWRSDYMYRQAIANVRGNVRASGAAPEKVINVMKKIGIAIDFAGYVDQDPPEN